jgi:uncharacterized protein YjlB
MLIGWEAFQMNKYSTDNPKADRLQAAVRSGQVINQRLKDDGSFPNNEWLPLLVYQGALALPQSNPAAMVEDLFESNGWNGSWRNGIYEFHHYHSTAHEVLGIYSGSAKVQLGGENGITLAVRRGDVVIIPAGVAHKNLGADSNFRVVGAYPLGQSPDMCYGKTGERPQADDHISRAIIAAHGSGLWRQWSAGGALGNFGLGITGCRVRALFTAICLKGRRPNDGATIGELYFNDLFDDTFRMHPENR